MPMASYVGTTVTAAAAGIAMLFATASLNWGAGLLVLGAAVCIGLILRPHRPAEESPPVMQVGVVPSSTRIVTLFPSSVVGADPLDIPVSGYLMHLFLLLGDSCDVTIHGFQAEIAERTTIKADAGGVQLPSVPIRTPDYEIFIDTDPPLIRPTFDEDGRINDLHPALPFTLLAGTQGQLTFAIITADERLTRWEFAVDMEWTGHRRTLRFEQHVTAHTGMTTIRPDGIVHNTPAHTISGNWRPRYLDESQLAFCHAAFGPDHPETLMTALQMATDMYEIGQKEQAALLNRETLQAAMAAHGDRNMVTMMATIMVAKDLHENGQQQKAQKMRDDLARMLEQMPPSDDQAVLRMRTLIDNFFD
jgi:hypothetical protein